MDGKERSGFSLMIMTCMCIPAIYFTIIYCKCKNDDCNKVDEWLFIPAMIYFGSIPIRVIAIMGRSAKNLVLATIGTILTGGTVIFLILWHILGIVDLANGGLVFGTGDDCPFIILITGMGWVYVGGLFYAILFIYGVAVILNGLCQCNCRKMIGSWVGVKMKSGYFEI